MKTTKTAKLKTPSVSNLWMETFFLICMLIPNRRKRKGEELKLNCKHK